jgi:hypothetical protein
MEVPAGNYVAGDGGARFARGTGEGARPYTSRDEYQRIVYSRVCLDLKHFAAMGKGIAHRAVHLRNAAQRICILDPATVAVRFANLTAFEHLAQICRRLHLASVRARFVNALVEGGIRALQSIAAKTSQDIGRIYQRLGGQQRQRANGQHSLRPVDERDGFFGFEHQRFDLRLLECVGAGNSFARCVDTFAFADQRQREMGQRSEVAARTHASLRRDEGRNPAIQHFAQRIDDDGANARVTLGQRIGAQEHHGADFRGGERFTDPHRMGAHKVDLQLTNLFADDAHVAQLADAGGDGIGKFVAGDNFIDDGSRPVDGLASFAR